MILISCNSQKTKNYQELGEEKLIELKLKTLGIRIKVPLRHSVLESDDFTTIDLNPLGRNIVQFRITILDSNYQESKYSESIRFKNGGILNYYTFVADGPVGSGGAEYRLEGVLEYGNRKFLITATDQSEFSKGCPEYCIKYLSTIEELKHLPKKTSCSIIHFIKIVEDKI